MQLKEAFTDAEAPGVGSIDTTNPVSWGKLFVGTFAVLTGFGVAGYGYAQVKQRLGTDDIQNPLTNTLGEF